MRIRFNGASLGGKRIMTIQICIGSACHLRGSYDVIEKLKSLIAADNMEDKITLKASFCLGRCGEFVTVKADGEFIEGVNAQTIESMYKEKLKPAALKG